MKSPNQELYEACPALQTWERERWKPFIENAGQPAQAAPQQQAGPSQTAQQAQQTMTGVLQMMQQNPADPNIGQQLPGLMQLLGKWQQELQTAAKQQQPQQQAQAQQQQPAQQAGAQPQAQQGAQPAAQPAQPQQG